MVLTLKKVSGNTSGHFKTLQSFFKHNILCVRFNFPLKTEGDQPWDFFGRNDVKAETPVLWPPHAKS